MKNKSTFYTCKYDKVFEKIFLNPDNKDLLKALLEFTIKTKIDDIKTDMTDVLGEDFALKDDIIDIILESKKQVINIEINPQDSSSSRVRNMVVLSKLYKTLIFEEGYINKDFIQIDFSWGVKDDIKVNRFKLVRKDDPTDIYIDNLLIIQINIDYILESWYENNEEEIEKYKYFIMLGLNEEELDKMNTNDEIINKYKQAIKEVNKDSKFIEYLSKEN